MAEIVLPVTFSVATIRDGGIYIRFPGGGEECGIVDGNVLIRPAFKVDPSDIPVGASIDEIHFGGQIITATSPGDAYVGLYSGVDLETDADQETYDGCDVSGAPYLTSGFLGTPGPFEIEITSMGSTTDLEAALGSTNFAIALRLVDEDPPPTRVATIAGYNVDEGEFDRPYLRVVYTEGADETVGGGLIRSVKLARRSLIARPRIDEIARYARRIAA